MVSNFVFLVIVCPCTPKKQTNKHTNKSPTNKFWASTSSFTNYWLHPKPTTFLLQPKDLERIRTLSYSFFVVYRCWSVGWWWFFLIFCWNCLLVSCVIDYPSVGSNSTTLSVVTKANNRGGGFRCLVFLFGECGNVLCRSKFGACLVWRSKRWSFGHFVANIWSKFWAFFFWFGLVWCATCFVQCKSALVLRGGSSARL